MRIPVLEKLSRRDQRAVLAAAAALALFLLLRFLLFPLLERWPEPSADLQQKELALQRSQRLVAESGLQRALHSGGKERLKSLDAGLLESPSPSLANAEWQRLVRELAESRGIELGRSEFLRLQELDAHYSLVAGQVQFRCRLDQLVDFIVTLGTSPKLLGVPRLRILATSGEQERPLNVEMTIAAVMPLSLAGTEKERESERKGE